MADDWVSVEPKQTPSAPDGDWTPVAGAAPKQSTPAPQMSRMDRFGTGLLDAPVGLAQATAHIAPEFLVSKETTAAVDEAVRRREERIKQERGPNAGFDWWRLGGDIANPINYLPAGRVAEGASMAARMGRAALQGAGAAAAQPATLPNTGYWTEKGIQAGFGAAGGAAVEPALAGSGAVVRWLTGMKSPEALRDKATQQILKRIDQSGATAQDMLDLLNEAPHKPLAIADIGGTNAQSLMGRIYRTPGEAKDLIERTMRERDLNAGLRLHQDINQAFGADSAYRTFQTMIGSRSAAAKPLFEKAYEGGSMAPLEAQFRNAFSDAVSAERAAAREFQQANTEVTAASARLSQAGDDVYRASGANQGMREAQARLAEARAKLMQATHDKNLVLESLRGAQEDIASGKKGAVWSPRIAEFLKNPRVQEGIRRGLRIERDEALAEGRPMLASDYAIIGTDPAGEPVVGNVPTMRLLAVAKEGLDRMLQSDTFRNPLTGQLNKEGVAIDKMRNSLLTELDRINQDYKAARAQWSGDSQSMEALKLGEKFFQLSPEVISDTVAKMLPNDREFFKLGIAARLRDTVAKTGPRGDEALRISGNQYVRDQLRPLFSSPEEYDRFIKSVMAETKMFETGRRQLGGSQTAERAGEGIDLAGAAHLGRGVLEASTGGPISWAIYNIARGIEKLRPNINPKLALEMAKQLVDPKEASRVIGAMQNRTPKPTVAQQAAPYVVPSVALGTQPVR